MKSLLLILGIVSFSTLAQQRSTPANEKQLKREESLSGKEPRMNAEKRGSELN